MTRPLRTWATVLGVTGGTAALFVTLGTTFGSVVNFTGSALGGDVTYGAARVLLLIVLVGLVGSGAVARWPFVGGSLMLASGGLAYGWVRRRAESPSH